MHSCNNTDAEKTQRNAAKQLDLDGAQLVESASECQWRHSCVLLADLFTKLFIRHISRRQRSLQLRQKLELCKRFIP